MPWRWDVLNHDDAQQAAANNTLYLDYCASKGAQILGRPKVQVVEGEVARNQTRAKNVVSDDLAAKEGACEHKQTEAMVPAGDLGVLPILEVSEVKGALGNPVGAADKATAVISASSQQAGLPQMDNAPELLPHSAPMASVWPFP